jgi:hypothetical protein
MADAVAMQPVRRPLRVVRIKNESESVASVQLIMQHAGAGLYQEKERHAATWNAAGCGSGLSESDMELVRSQSLACGLKRKVAVYTSAPQK